MLRQMTMLKIFIFCCSDVGDSSKAMLRFLIFAIVISFCMAHFRDETSRILRYVYGLFYKRMGSCCCL